MICPECDGEQQDPECCFCLGDGEVCDDCLSRYCECDCDVCYIDDDQDPAEGE